MAAAGAVLRPTGSSTMACGATPASRICSAIRKRCSVLQMISGAAKAGALGAQHGVLNQAAVPGQGQQLFGKQAAGQRPKPRSGATGQNDGMDQGHGQNARMEMTGYLAELSVR